MPAQQNHIRTDILTNRQVIVATGRESRPVHVNAGVLATENAFDPFLQGNEHSTPSESLALRRGNSKTDAADWLLRVVPNRYPAVVNEKAEQSGCSEMLPSQPAVGRHEVVIECPDSITRMADLSVVSVSRILFAWQKRLQQLGRDYPFVSIFRNEGFGAGASLPHCHSQILASDVCSSALKNRIKVAQDFRTCNKRSLFAAWLNEEIREESRVVRLNPDVAVVCPFASRFPWQIRFCPLSDGPAAFEELRTTQLIEIAADLLNSVQTLAAVRESISFNLTLTLPPAGQSPEFPWMLDLMPRPNRIAGFELITDIDINTVTPEFAAQTYRESAERRSTCSPEEICPAGFEWRESGR